MARTTWSFRAPMGSWYSFSLEMAPSPIRWRLVLLAVLDRIYGADGYRYDPWSQARIHEFDYNGDGRADLVTWNQDRFEAHLQDERGMFTAEPVTFETGVAFDSDDLSYLSTGDMTGRVLHSFSDLNGDGAADLVVLLPRWRQYFQTNDPRMKCTSAHAPSMAPPPMAAPISLLISMSRSNLKAIFSLI